MFMYLSNQEFYTTYLASLPAMELFPYLEVIEKLLIQYGPYKLQSKEFQTLIKKISPTLFQILSLLIAHKKLTKLSIKKLTSLIKIQDESLKQQYTISSPSKKINTTIAKTIKTQKPSVTIEKQQTEML